MENKSAHFNLKPIRLLEALSNAVIASVEAASSIRGDARTFVASKPKCASRLVVSAAEQNPTTTVEPASEGNP